MLILTAEDIGRYERLTRRIFHDNPKTRKFHTQVVMDSVKLGLTIPLQV